MKTKLELRKDIITTLSNESLGAVLGGYMTEIKNGCDYGQQPTDICNSSECGSGGDTGSECYASNNCGGGNGNGGHSGAGNCGEGNSGAC